ncbi:hypothetical protein HPMBJEAJ_00121 [Aeromonas phage avDM6]|nr:hypothetical protein HPMBJEAJ_00121 [Aeromonas phage avDM6]
MTNVQVFFSTRAAARQASFGKMTDNGTTSEKRWARTVTATSNGNKTLSIASGVRKNGYKDVTVITKKTKTLVH